MGYYRLYRMGAPTGRFMGFEEFNANDDLEAVRLAEGYAGERALELWCGKRKVHAIPAQNSQAAG